MWNSSIMVEETKLTCCFNTILGFSKVVQIFRLVAEVVASPEFRYLSLLDVLEYTFVIL